MPGYFSPEEVALSWPDFDCAVHVPISENSGGAVEPLNAGVPVIVGRVGALPEIVIEGVTGKLVPIRNPEALASAVLEALKDPIKYRKMAKNGQSLVASLFDVERTAREVLQIYTHILYGSPRPRSFSAELFFSES